MDHNIEDVRCISENRYFSNSHNFAAADLKKLFRGRVSSLLYMFTFEAKN